MTCTGCGVFARSRVSPRRSGPGARPKASRSALAVPFMWGLRLRGSPSITGCCSSLRSASVTFSRSQPVIMPQHEHTPRLAVLGDVVVMADVRELSFPERHVRTSQRGCLTHRTVLAAEPVRADHVGTHVRRQLSDAPPSSSRIASQSHRRHGSRRAEPRRHNAHAPNLGTTIHARTGISNTVERRQTGHPGLRGRRSA